MPKPFSNKAHGFCSFLTQEILRLILIWTGVEFHLEIRVGPGGILIWSLEEQPWGEGFGLGLPGKILLCVLLVPLHLEVEGCLSERRFQGFLSGFRCCREMGHSLAGGTILILPLQPRPHPPHPHPLTL